MLEAQEMFRTSNKVTRPEKALILGFMAGSRGQYLISKLLNLSLLNICSMNKGNSITLKRGKIFTPESLKLTPW